MLISPSQSLSPFLKEKAHVAIKKQNDHPIQHMKRVVHLKPSFKWALNKRVGKASSSGKDLDVEAGLESPMVGSVVLCSAQPCGPPMDSPAAFISKIDGA